MKTVWVVIGADSHEIREFSSRKAALEWVRDVKRFDREIGITGEDWFIYKEELI